MRRRLFTQATLAGVAAPLAGCAHMSAPASSQAAAPAASRAAAPIGQLLQAICTDPAKPLVSIAGLSMRNGQVAFVGAVGQARLSPDASADADTLYRVASISKLITTLGVMRLVEQSKLALDADVNTYLGWNLRNPVFPNTPVTLRMLLSHTSSLRDDLGYYWTQEHLLQDALTPGGKLFDKGQAWAPQRAPGQFFQYANLPWGVIGSVMESATGKRFDVLMRDEVFGPLGIRGGFNPAAFSQAELANLATLYRKRRTIDGKEVWDPKFDWQPQVDDYRQAAPVSRADANYRVGSNGTLFGPQGSARASANGLGVVMRMLLSEGKLGGGQAFLTPETVRMMLARQWTLGQQAGDSYKGLMRAWGLGNQHFTDASMLEGKSAVGDRLVAQGGFTGVGHLGDAWGLTSAFVLDPRSKNGLIFLVGGPGFNPEPSDPGRYSSMYGYEERILTALSSAWG